MTGIVSASINNTILTISYFSSTDSFGISRNAPTRVAAFYKKKLEAEEK
jgi:hypothetical protein